MKTAAQMAAAWQAGMRNPATQQKYKDGIAATTINPMAAAASDVATQKYLQNVNASVSSGRRQQRLMSVPMDFWKTQSMNIGANNLSTGAAKGLTKVQAHFNKFAAAYQQAHDAAHAIPNDGSSAAITARVMAAINVMKVAAGKPAV